MNDLKFNEQKQIEPRFDEQPKPTKKMEAITMNELKLNKQHEPEFDELSRMLCDLRNFLSIEPNFNDAGYRRNLEALIDFQDDDGSFKLFDSYRIPSDARVDFCFIPTYISTAILMKACLTDPERFTQRHEDALRKGLLSSCARNLTGHGYEGRKGQVESLNIFMKAGLREFIDLHSDFCPEFTGMIEKIISSYSEMESEAKFTGPWGESYEDEIRSVNRYFSQRKVFVYGTLMRGEANHGYLEGSTCLGMATIRGYDMHNCGWYPAIIKGDSLIIGELYNVLTSDIPSIDALEGEGTLYLKKVERVRINGDTRFALVYVYNGDCSSYERIPSWRRDYVWYVSYGSNMLYDRFMCYIKGGSFEGSRPHPPCNDTTEPVEARPVEIPYGMYFANSSGSWQGKGVSFLDITGKGRSLGVAYLITREQFDHVVLRENAGRAQNRDCGWYEDTITLGEMDGIEVATLTNAELRPYNEPCDDYLDTLRKGIRENWPGMSEEEIRDYLMGCMR